MTKFLAKIYLSLIRVLKNKKKKLALTFLYCINQETWLDDSWKLIYINQSDSTISFTWKNAKMFYISSKHFSIFNKEPPASWVAHITRDFLTRGFIPVRIIIPCLVWQQIQMPCFVWVFRSLLIFLNPGVSYSLLKQIFKLTFTYYIWK